jgi:large subunit ribosomal protein L21
VAPGQVISVEKLPGTRGERVEFSAVLLVNREGELITGRERLSRVRVAGEVVSQGLGRKVTVVKFKRRKNYRRERGHRQPATRVRITNIEV